MQSSYTQQPDYETALRETPEDLPSLAVIVQPLGYEFTYPPGYPIASASEPQAVLAMTTRFKEVNDQWGWIILAADTKELLGDILIDSNQIGMLTYWSQVNHT